MKHKTSQSLYAYWDEVRRGRIAPRRFDIEPSRISDLLSETFILERPDAARLRFRLAGTRICEDWRRVRGASFLAGWSPDDRLTLERRLASVAHHGAVGLFTFAAATAHGRAVHYEMLVLPLTHTNDRVDRLLGALGAPQRPEWLGWSGSPRSGCSTTNSSGRTAARIRDPPSSATRRPSRRTCAARGSYVRQNQFRVYEGGLSVSGAGGDPAPGEAPAALGGPHDENGTPLRFR